MSRIAKYPVAVPAGVEVTIGDSQISIKGPLGGLFQALNGDVIVERDGDQLVLFRFKHHRSKATSCKTESAGAFELIF